MIVADLSSSPQAGAAFNGILEEQEQPAEGSTALTRALMTQCLIYLLRSVSEEDGPPLPWLTALEDPELGPAVDLLLTQPNVHHTLDSLADAAVMSRSTFAARFHDAFGQPPMAFLHEIRMRRAAQLLERSRTSGIEEVAQAVGLASRSHFSEAFKVRFGVTPGAYRDSTK